MDKGPWFKFYPADWMTDSKVTMMTLEQQGAYLRLLSYQWINGSIPSDEKSLAKVLAVGVKTLRSIWPGISDCFQKEGDNLVNSRLHNMKCAFQEKSQKASSSSLKRWENQENQSSSENHTDANALRSESDGIANAMLRASGSDSVSKTKEEVVKQPKPSVDDDPRFQEFWSAYPRKTGKADAKKAWKSIVKTDTLALDAIAGVKHFEDGEWLDRPVDKIPYPATFLRKFSEDWIGLAAKNAAKEPPPRQKPEWKPPTPEEIAAEKEYRYQMSEFFRGNRAEPPVAPSHMEGANV